MKCIKHYNSTTKKIIDILNMHLVLNQLILIYELFDKIFFLKKQIRLLIKVINLSIINLMRFYYIYFLIHGRFRNKLDSGASEIS